MEPPAITAMEVTVCIQQQTQWDLQLASGIPSLSCPTLVLQLTAPLELLFRKQEVAEMMGKSNCSKQGEFRRSFN